MKETYIAESFIFTVYKEMLFCTKIIHIGGSDGSPYFFSSMSTIRQQWSHMPCCCSTCCSLQLSTLAIWYVGYTYASSERSPGFRGRVTVEGPQNFCELEWKKRHVLTTNRARRERGTNKRK